MPPLRSPLRPADSALRRGPTARQLHDALANPNARVARAPRIAPAMATEAQQPSIVAVYPTHAKGESALRALQDSGLDMKCLSVVGKGRHTDELAVGFSTSEKRVILAYTGASEVSLHTGTSAPRLAVSA